MRISGRNIGKRREFSEKYKCYVIYGSCWGTGTGEEGVAGKDENGKRQFVPNEGDES